MDATTYDDAVFEKLVYVQKTIKGREFQSCTFKACDFSNSDFSHNKFLDCTFDGCNLVMLKLNNATLNNVVFKNSKLLGVNFTDCQAFLFSVQFEHCILDYASFMGRKMPKTVFANCALKEVNFTQANLAGSVFDQTDLSGALFNRTDLTSADFSTAYHYHIEPELNSLKNAVFSMHGIAGLLSKYQIKII